MRCRTPIWERPNERALKVGRAQHLLRQEPHPARRQPRSRRRPGHDAARPQRRRQDHDAAQHHGADPAARGPRLGVRRARPRAGRRFASPRSASAMCPKAASLPQPHRRGKSHGAAGAARPVDIRRHLPAVSAACGAPLQPRPATVRRRAGDAVDRPRAAAQSEAADPRRAVAGAGAADRRAKSSASWRRCAPRESRCCWSSRTCA